MSLWCTGCSNYPAESSPRDETLCVGRLVIVWLRAAESSSCMCVLSFTVKEKRGKKKKKMLPFHLAGARKDSWETFQAGGQLCVHVSAQASLQPD